MTAMRPNAIRKTKSLSRRKKRMYFTRESSVSRTRNPQSKRKIGKLDLLLSRVLPDNFSYSMRALLAARAKLL